MKRRNRTEFNETLRQLLGGCCSVCGVPSRKRRIVAKGGEVFRVSNLEFHHLDPRTKTYEVTAAPTRAEALRELEKCVLLCSHCHDNYHKLDAHFASIPLNDNAIFQIDGANDHV